MLGGVDFTEFAWPLTILLFAPLVIGVIAFVTMMGYVPVIVGAFASAVVGACSFRAGWQLGRMSREGLRRNPPQDFQR